MSSEKKPKGSGLDDDYELVLLTINEVFVYRIPPMKSAAGYQCKEWGLETPLMSGSMQVVSRGNILMFRFRDADSNLFAQTVPFDLTEIDHGSRIEQHVTPVTDSSRYFVVRLKNAKTGQTAPLGFGFRERSSAFDMNATITDRIKQVHRTVYGKPKKEKAQFAAPDSAAADDEPEVDYESSGNFGLGDGQVLELNIKGFGGNPDGAGHTKKKPSSASSNKPLSAFRLAPPPEEAAGGGIESSMERLSVRPEKHSQSGRSERAAASQPEEDDWGDFSSAKPASSPPASRPAASPPGGAALGRSQKPAAQADLFDPVAAAMANPQPKKSNADLDFFFAGSSSTKPKKADDDWGDFSSGK